MLEIPRAAEEWQTCPLASSRGACMAEGTRTYGEEAVQATPALEALRAALLTGLAYYAGARIGLALTFAPMPLSILWPPNALLLGALIVLPMRRWWAAIAGAFPAHLLAELQGGVPPAMVLGWFVSNTSEAFIGATLFHYFSRGRDL